MRFPEARGWPECVLSSRGARKSSAQKNGGLLRVTQVKPACFWILLPPPQEEETETGLTYPQDRLALKIPFSVPI